MSRITVDVPNGTPNDVACARSSSFFRASLVTLLFFWSAVATTKLDVDARGGFVLLVAFFSPLRRRRLMIRMRCCKQKRSILVAVHTDTRISTRRMHRLPREKEQNA